MELNFSVYNSIFNQAVLNRSIFSRDILINVENSVSMDYVSQCLEHFVSLNDEMIDTICERISAYHQYMLEEWDDEFVEEINQEVPKDIKGKDILAYVIDPEIYIFPPAGKGIGYLIEGQCAWEPEHGIDIILLDDKVIYVGMACGLDPWAEEDEVECDY